jgi:hypothetical protein
LANELAWLEQCITLARFVYYLEQDYVIPWPYQYITKATSM